MQTASGLLLLTGAYPFWRAWQANRQTSLLHAVTWAMLAWAAWTVVALSADHMPVQAVAASGYTALCLTGCAGVAVLGARRPGVAAWNFVVAALLGVNLLPLGEGLTLGKSLNLDGLRITCVTATLAVGILNYLPTRLGPAAVLLLLGSVLQLIALVGPAPNPFLKAGWSVVAWFALAVAPWLALAFLRSAPARDGQVDRLWFDYRDRFGLVWGLRLREQFNRSVEHAGWPVILHWQGLRLLPGAASPDADAQTAIVATLRALMKRFGPK